MLVSVLSSRASAAAVRPLFLLLLISECLVLAYPHLQPQLQRRQIDARQVQNEYDYVIVGGGQSGLVLANRLSEDSEATVLVVEYGDFNNNPAQIEPSSAVRYPRDSMYNLTSVPQPGIGGDTQPVYAAAVVGGGSTINGMMLNRGAADDYDNWEKLGNEGWGFDGLLPYFIKSSTHQAPSPQLAEEFGITWNESVYGDGPIKLSYAPFQWPGVNIQWDGLVEAGAEPQLDGSVSPLDTGNAYGVFWYPSAIDNRTVTRSYARNEYYDPVESRANLELITGHRVNEVLFDDDLRAAGVTIQQRGAPSGQNTTTTVSARREVVLAAGALHSPQILQRSGVGPASLLEEAGLDVLVDLPGVGSNLQDHPVGSVSFRYDTNVFPNPETAYSNATFMEWAQREWTENRAGPFAQTTGNTAGLIPLTLTSPNGWQEIIDEYLAQDVAEFLPSGYTSEQVAGYEKQRELLADSFGRDDNAVLEFPIGGGGSGAMVMTKEVSRGTVHLDTSDPYASPIVDYNTFINPVDVLVQVENLRFIRRFHETDAMQVLSPVEQSPGAAVTGDEELQETMRRGTRSSTAHMSGTCAMMAREDGGVVGADLLVHGVSGLSVVDASVMPLIPGAHTCSTVYAVAEKAADIIKQRHA